MVQDASSRIKSGCNAEFMTNQTINDDDVEILFQLRAANDIEVAQVINKMKMMIIEKTETRPKRIVTIKHGSICKTTIY